MLKKIPWWQPQVTKQDYPFIKKALDNNFVNEGPLTTQFENEIKKILGVKYAFATTSGTVAIFLALKGLGIKAGDEVLVPDITFIATANAVDLCSATPILVDVDPQTLNISPEAILKSITPKTKAILPVHVSGRPANMDEILKIAKDHKLFVVEDAAEAFTSKYKNKFLGTLGDAGCFSFSPNKTISTGQGGMIVTNSDELASKIRPLKDQGRPFRGTGGDDLHNTIGYNFKFTDLQAGMGLGQLKHLEKRTARMRRNHELYVQNLSALKDIKIFRADLKNGELPQWTDILVNPPSSDFGVAKRDALDAYLRENNIECRRYWHPLHRQLAYKMPDDNFPNSTTLSPRALWLPSAFTLTDKDILRVCNKIKEFFLHF